MANTFAGSSNGGGLVLARTLSVEKQASVDLGVLQSASRIVNEKFSQDAQAVPDLGESLSAHGSGVSSSYSVFQDDLRSPFQIRRLVAIPKNLYEYYKSASHNSHMGIMPEIERVWVTIDHQLFLWDYLEGQEICSFVDQPDVITHVALIKPKKSLFVDEITNLLVICTPVSVLLLALSNVPVTAPNSRVRNEIKLFATDLSVSTEIEMASVAGTDDGRIFMYGAQDGSLYELHYQENESWFGKRVQLVNHSVGGVQSLLPRFASSSAEDRVIDVVSDPTRNLIYTLTQKNTITIYRPTSAKTVEHVQTLSGVYKSARDKAPGSAALLPDTFQIIKLHPVDPTESRSGVQLIAVTSFGVRLYFAPMGMAFGTTYRTLQLLHVRLAPSNLQHPDEKSAQPISPYGNAAIEQRNSAPFLFTRMEQSCYTEGLTLATQPGETDGFDYVLCTTPDLTKMGNLGQVNIPNNQAQPSYMGSTPTRGPLTEYAEILRTTGQTWDIVSRPKGIFSAIPTGTPVPSVTNELATQFTEFPPVIMLLTNVGVLFLIKRRALDYLKATLEILNKDSNVGPVIQFRDSFGRNQTCAMLLGLAAGNIFLNEMNTLATSEDAVTSTTSPISPELVSLAKQAFYDFGERPVWTERAVYGHPDAPGTATYSGRREGLALYFSRLVRPIWKAKLTSVGPTGLQESSLSDSLLVIVQKNLHALKEFLDKNPHLFHSSGEASSRGPSVEQQAWKAEQDSVAEITSLLKRTIEAISFILLLHDYRISGVIGQCEAEVQQLIASLTYEDLITSTNGQTISRALVNVVIDQQIGQQISVDTISEVLQHRCGSFCSTDDVMLYKAKENVRRAAETKSAQDQQKWLSEALRLYTKGARIIDLERLREIVGDFQQLGYARGAVELPLTCAEVYDATGAGLDYWNAESPAGDPRQAAFEERLRCYELILDSLTAFENSPQPLLADNQNPDSLRTNAYELAFASTDEVFHSTLYDWLISRNMADDLLEIRPPYLETHLRRSPSFEKYQLLWQFYVKDGQPLRAAEVLETIADSTDVSLTLDTRLECLTLAVGNAKSHPVSVGGRHETAIQFLQGLEEKLDVAQVQLEIYNVLQPHMSDAPEIGERIRLLTTRLFTMSELFQEYALPFDVPNLKLLCLYVSEHRDENMSREIWNQIFNQILEDESEPGAQADLVLSQVIPLGQRYHTSDSAFPLRTVADLLVRFALERKQVLPFGWISRTLVQCGVPYSDVWDILHEMYESHIPPFNSQLNVQTLSSDIAVLLSDWLQEAKRPNSSVGRGEFPVGRIDLAVDVYLRELAGGRTETKTTYENIKRELRRNW